jgi:hypothetical protein
MMFKEINAVYSANHAKHKYAVGKRSVTDCSNEWYTELPWL